MRDFFSLERWLPGLAALLQYQRAWLMPDLRAGLSVAAVALPVAIAYAELAGVGAIVGAKCPPWILVRTCNESRKRRNHP